MSEFSDKDSTKHGLIEDVVSTAVELGFAVVQEVAAEALIKKPGLSLKNLLNY